MGHGALFDLNGAIGQWREQLVWREGLEPSDVAEMESHLRDEIESLTAEDRSEREAFFIGVHGFGLEDELSNRFRVANWEQVLRERVIQAPGLAANYLKVALRSLLKHKVYSIVNLVGLSIGLVCVTLATAFVHYEWSYERVHENGDRIFRLIRRVVSPGGGVEFHGGSTNRSWTAPAPPEAEAKASSLRPCTVLGHHRRAARKRRQSEHYKIRC